MKNWLVTWESWDDKKIKDKDRISAILDDGLPLGMIRTYSPGGSRIAELKVMVGKRSSTGTRFNESVGCSVPFSLSP